MKTAGGAPPIRAGSPVTATSSTRPLLNGATLFMYEGAPNHPYPNRWWRMVEYYGITILYTAPTAIRGLMRYGDNWANRHDLSSLRLLGSVGEPINPEAWRWYLQRDRQAPLPDHGYLVADRDRRLHDHPAADHPAQAGLGHPPVLRHRCGRRRTSKASRWRSARKATW